MKIVEFAHQRNPEQIAEQLNSLVDQLKANVETAAQDGASFDFVERTVLTSVLEIGRQALDLLLALQGDGDHGETVQTHDGKTARRSETKSTTNCGPSLASTFSINSFIWPEKTSRSACVRSVPGFHYRPAAGRFCYGSFRRCSASIRHTIKR